MPEVKINQPNMFMEMAQNFTDPRESIREGIQDSIDANAKNIFINVSLDKTAEGQSVKIIIEDDGTGIPANNFSNFYNLSDSTKNGSDTIGSKGVGTSAYFNSDCIILESWVDSVKFVSVAEKPYATLFNKQLITYTEPEIVPNTESKQSGTRVTLEGYLKNTGENFIEHYSHAALRDYILWFTAFGSIRGQFEKIENPPRLHLRTYDSFEAALQKEFRYEISNGYEEIRFGHVFPEREVTSTEELKKIAEEARENNWDDFFSKRIFAKEVFIDGLKEPVQFLIWLEGDQCKRQYNPMLRDKFKSNSSDRSMMYKSQSRYGFWCCKDYILIDKIDDWVNGKGSYTKYHAFVNYNDFSLTANRSSIDNTNPNVIKKIKDKLNEILDELQKMSVFKQIKDIKISADNERSAASEDAEFAKRLKRCKLRKSLVLGNVRYYEPVFEGEAALLFDGILQVFPDCVKFEILDYNTNDGIDFLTRSQLGIPIENDNTVGFTELKHNLEKTRLNHSFTMLRNIVIYDAKGLKAGNTIIDLSGKKLLITKNGNDLVLADHYGEVGHSIKIFVMKDFLESKNLKMN